MGDTPFSCFITNIENTKFIINTAIKNAVLKKPVSTMPNVSAIKKYDVLLAEWKIIMRSRLPFVLLNMKVSTRVIGMVIINLSTASGK